MWWMLGPLPVDCFAWESFGEDWVTDTRQAAEDRGRAASLKADYGELPDLLQSRSRRMTSCSLWNGTTSRRARAGWRLDRNGP